jgi:hypothetical protein
MKQDEDEAKAQIQEKSKWILRDKKVLRSILF